MVYVFFVVVIECRGVVIDGKLIVGQIWKEIVVEVVNLKENVGKVFGLVVVLVGIWKDFEIYVCNKKKVCEEVGFVLFGVILLEDVI